MDVPTETVRFSAGPRPRKPSVLLDRIQGPDSDVKRAIVADAHGLKNIQSIKRKSKCLGVDIERELLSPEPWPPHNDQTVTSAAQAGLPP